MKTINLIFFLILFYTFIGFGQNNNQLKLRENTNVILTNENEYKIFYKEKKLPKDQEVLDEIIKDINGIILSKKYLIRKKTEEIEEKEIKNQFTVLKLKHKITANLLYADNKIIIYPYKFVNNHHQKDSIINDFFDKNEVYIKVSERFRYKFNVNHWNFGLVSVPFKLYFNNEFNNRDFNPNLLLNFGYSFGSRSFLKLPHEEKPREYQNIFSLNFLNGLTIMKLDKNNRKEDSDREGNFIAYSTGLSLGYNYRNLNFMIALGYDVPLYENYFKSRNSYWVGVGFGFNLINFN